MSKVKHLDRRGFLKGAATGAVAGATTLVTAPLASAAMPQAEQAPGSASAAATHLTPQQTAIALAAESAPPQPEDDGYVIVNPGSDFMVDVIKTLGFEYIAANPSSSFRGIHESFINYNHNKGPEWITCLHEEVSVNIANGYYAVEGKPMAVMTFAPCGITHASMAILGSFVGHTPTYIMCSTILDAVERRPSTDWWEHAVMDPAALVRDFTKWDDTPASLQHFAESAVRAYKMAMTEPRGPVMIVVDGAMQEKSNPNPPGRLHIPKLTLETPPVGDPNALAEAAKWLVGAKYPLIVCGDVVHDEEGQNLLVELAETLQAPVQSGGFGAARTIPNRHPLAGTGNVALADVVLALNEDALFNFLNDYRDQAARYSTPRIGPGTKVISISANDLYMKSNYQEVDRFQEVDLAITGDPQASLPGLIECCKKLITSDQRIAMDARAKKYAAASAAALERAKVEATYGWDASPISLPRLNMELYDVIKDKDWASVGGAGGRLWNFDKFYRQKGEANGGGVGGDFPCTVGAALAHKKHGRLCVSVQKDGDMMFVNNAMWTAVHHQIPMLIVMHNNRAYHQEVMHLQRMANRRQRGMENVASGCPGTFIRDPDIDFAMLAKSMGAYAEGPITNPNDLRPALVRAVAQVEKGQVALLDTITQPR